jgi:hypothetical protein
VVRTPGFHPGNRGSIPRRATKNKTMRRLIYDLYYANEISVEIAEKLLAQLEKSRSKARRY